MFITAKIIVLILLPYFPLGTCFLEMAPAFYEPNEIAHSTLRETPPMMPAASIIGCIAGAKHGCEEVDAVAAKGGSFSRCEERQSRGGGSEGTSLSVSRRSIDTQIDIFLYQGVQKCY